MQGKKNFLRKRRTEGGHACYIPHATNDLSGAQNCNSFYIKLLNGKVLIVPANFYHYVDPEAHKKYARFMPSLEVAEWAITKNYLEFIPCDAVINDDFVERYGYISFVKKNGFLDCGCWFFNRYKSRPYRYINYAGSLVTSQGDDAHISNKVPVQKPEYSELCKTITKRFAFQSHVYVNECLFSKIRESHYDKQKMKVFLAEVSAFVNSADKGKYEIFSETFDKIVSKNPFGGGLMPTSHYHPAKLFDYLNMND